MSFLNGLCLLFIGLKLTDIVDWSWFIVLSPFWGQLVFGLILGVIYGLTNNKK